MCLYWSKNQNIHNPAGIQLTIKLEIKYPWFPQTEQSNNRCAEAQKSWTDGISPILIKASLQVEWRKGIRVVER
jgi:hypothetical protein